MINEQRVILMTQLASYGQGEGKKNVKTGSYFRSDYIAVQMLKSLIFATIAFCILVGLYVLYDFEDFMQNLYEIDLFAFAGNIVVYYVIMMTVYLVVTYIIATWRYVKAKKSLKSYYYNLKKLNSLYNETR